MLPSTLRWSASFGHSNSFPADYLVIFINWGRFRGCPSNKSPTVFMFYIKAPRFSETSTRGHHRLHIKRLLDSRLWLWPWLRNPKLGHCRCSSPMSLLAALPQGQLFLLRGGQAFDSVGARSRSHHPRTTTEHKQRERERGDGTSKVQRPLVV